MDHNATKGRGELRLCVGEYMGVCVVGVYTGGEPE